MNSLNLWLRCFRLVCLLLGRCICGVCIWLEWFREIVNALNTMDFPVVMGSVLFISIVFIIINLLVDLIYIWLDPRIKT